MMKEQDLIVKSISEVDLTDLALPAFAFYYNTQEYPGQYLVRIHDGGCPTNVIILRNNLIECCEDVKLNYSGTSFLPSKNEDEDPNSIGLYI